MRRRRRKRLFAVVQRKAQSVMNGPGGNFIQGRHAATLGIGADLEKTWDLDVSYTRYGGAGQYNLLNDRSFVAASIKFSF